MNARVRSGRGAAGPRIPDPAVALLWGGTAPVLVTGVVMALVVASSGSAAVTGTALGAGAVCAALSTGPLLQWITRPWSPPAVMLVSLMTYALVVMAFGVGYVALRGVDAVSPSHLGVSLILCSLAWTAGALRAVLRMRMLAFPDAEEPASGGAPEALDGSSPAGSGGSGSEHGSAGGSWATGSELPNAH